MRNVVLASILGASASAYVLPSVAAGPVHFRVTQPHSVTALMPHNGTNTAFPTTPLQFVITDITLGRAFANSGAAIEILANGTTVFVGQTGGTAYGGQPSIHLNTGILIPAGAALAAESGNGNASSAALENGITLSGYVQ